MKLRISNLGVIESMEIDMAKPFILFAGDNGTGKTYVSTFVYCLIRHFTLYLVNDYYFVEGNKLPVTEETKLGWTGQLDPDKLYSIIESYLFTQRKDIVEYMNLGNISRLFKCEIVTTREEWKEELLRKNVQLGSRFDKKSNTFTYNIIAKNEDVRLAQALFLVSLFFTGSVVHFATAERNGIYTFSKELSVGRLQVPETMSESRYPLPIAVGLADAEDLKNKKKRTSPYRALANEIEHDILHGGLSVTDEGVVEFSYREKMNLGLNQSSSAIKTLAPMVFFLKYIATGKDILFIDEPELNLHPKNQVLLAKVFGKMINAGLRLVISTHSDYIIREINNMIMADELTKAGSDKPAKMGYDKNLCLSANKFAPYLFENGSGRRGKVAVRPLEVDRYGFAMPSIDEAINRQNEVTESLYEVLKYDYPNN